MSAVLFRGGFLLCRISPVVHEKKIDIPGIVDEERFVAGWHHVAGFLVGTIANLSHNIRQSLYHLATFAMIFHGDVFFEMPNTVRRTFGIAAWPLNRLRTRLSIPFGFLQLGSTHM